MRDRSARHVATDGETVVTDDWQKLGDVVARIVARAEVTSAPPIAKDDAAVFLMLLREIYGPPAPAAARRKEGQAK